MQKKYYISDILFDVSSEIALDEYETEEKFEKPVLLPQETYTIEVKLADRIEIPDSEPVMEDSCRAWLGMGVNEKAKADDHVLDELRIYPYGNLSDHAISSRIFDHQITITVRRNIYNIYMHGFRIWSYIFLERILLKNHALILHSASIIYNGKAILFTAPSETGKTTQTDIWHRNEPSTTDLNGDRTILQKTAEGWMACGIPISGTSLRCEQAVVPISVIAFVNRAVTDSVSELRAMRKIQLLYGQVTVFSADENDAGGALTLLEELVHEVKVVQLNCTMKDSAYRVLLDEIAGH